MLGPWLLVGALLAMGAGFVVFLFVCERGSR